MKDQDTYKVGHKCTWGPCHGTQTDVSEQQAKPHQPMTQDNPDEHADGEPFRLRGARAADPEILMEARTKKNRFIWSIILLLTICNSTLSRYERMKILYALSFMCGGDSASLGPRRDQFSLVPTPPHSPPRRVTGRHREVFWRPWSERGWHMPTACCSVQLHGISVERSWELDKVWEDFYLWDKVLRSTVDTRTLLAEERIFHTGNCGLRCRMKQSCLLRLIYFFRGWRDKCDEMK